MGDALINKVWGRAPLMQTHDSSIHHFVKPEGSAFPSASRTFVRPSRALGHYQYGTIELHRFCAIMCGLFNFPMKTKKVALRLAMALAE